MPLYNLKASFNINLKHSSSVKACSINKLTLYITSFGVDFFCTKNLVQIR